MNPPWIQGLNPYLKKGKTVRGKYDEGGMHMVYFLGFREFSGKWRVENDQGEERKEKDNVRHKYTILGMVSETAPHSLFGLGKRLFIVRHNFLFFIEVVFLQL